MGKSCSRKNPRGTSNRELAQALFTGNQDLSHLEQNDSEDEDDHLPPAATAASSRMPPASPPPPGVILLKRTQQEAVASRTTTQASSAVQSEQYEKARTTIFSEQSGLAVKSTPLPMPKRTVLLRKHAARADDDDEFRR